jgi:hypothetical protein
MDTAAIRVHLEQQISHNSRYCGSQPTAKEVLAMLDEIERLRADKDVIRSQARNAAYERDIDLLEAEIERLRAAIFNTINDLSRKKPNIGAIRGYLSSVYDARAHEQTPKRCSRCGENHEPRCL